MELAFSTKKLRVVCEIESKAIDLLGNDAAKRLQSRLADLSAVSVVTELIAGKPQECLFKNQESFTIEVFDNYKIFFQANHVNTPLLPSGGCDWAKVSRIKIVSIER